MSTQPRVSATWDGSIYEAVQRDKYGRTVRHFWPTTEWFKTKVVVVTLPKVAWGHHDGARYLVNDWQLPVGRVIDGKISETPGKLTYVKTLKEARALVSAKIVR